MSLSCHPLPINCSVVFKHEYLLTFHSRQQFVSNYGLEMLYFFLIHIRITTELVRALKENVSVYPHLGTYHVKEALGKVLTTFPLCSREGSWRVPFYHIGRAVRAWSKHRGHANQRWNLKEQQLCRHLHQLHTIHNTIKTDRYNWINRK